MKINPCDSNPCENKANCIPDDINSPLGYTCQGKPIILRVICSVLCVERHSLELHGKYRESSDLFFVLPLL